MKLSFVTVLICVMYSQGVFAVPDKIVCYLGSWSIYRPGNGKFTVEDIDPMKCTHLIYSFVGIGIDGSITILDQWSEVNSGGMRRFNDLKRINPNLKTLIAMGGWSQGSLTFSQVAAIPHLRTALANNIVNFLDQYGFDGFDFDWEYPGQRGGSYNDKDNFAELLRVCRERFNSAGKNYLLTAAVAATATSAGISYDVPALSKYLDFINVMAYDFHGSYDGFTGQNAPLYASSVDVSDLAKEKNVEASIKTWIERGAAPEKIVLGMGVYGRSFTLATGNNQIGAPSAGPGEQGPYTMESGMLGYYEICDMVNQGGWTVVWDDGQQVPYAYKGNQWVGYDDPKSITVKVNFAKELNLGGLMIWSIETDDFRGTCGSKYPILTAINEAMRSSTPIVPQLNSSPSSNKTPLITTSKPATGEICKGQGYVKDPADCSKFYYCSINGGMVSFTCPEGLYFDDRYGNCNYKQKVDCEV